jgi:hypothetical protein
VIFQSRRSQDLEFGVEINLEIYPQRMLRILGENIEDLSGHRKGDKYTSRFFSSSSASSDH